ncbi:MAG TPA: glycosyltransferase family 2 protein [Acidimicrobiales bacterium]|nr:glycosyltransferase family 2 protein [Acidimicrobiales bacterium]
MDSQPSAPPVVTVVVATEQGDWFEETLAAVGAQDYPNQSVLVVDGSGGDPAPRVAAVLPDAYLRRPGNGSNFAALANDALETVQGAAFLVFCHDDVAPEPDAVRLMVEEALRSNAGIVGPKLVDWDDPKRLLDVGLAVDKTGASRPLVDRGELDQEQHDGVRDVFAVSSACMLARSDLFFTLGGFDPAMGDHGADVDLCWRAQVAGARVMVAPSARARHKEAGREATVDRHSVRLAARHRLRSVLKNYSVLHLLRVLPQVALVTVVEAVLAVFSRHYSRARALGAAWPWNLRRLGELHALRRTVRASRAVPDSEVRRLQVRGSVRMSVYLRRQLHAEDRARALVTAGQELVGRVGKGPAQAAAALLALLVLAFLLGSRQLLGGRLPVVGQFAPLPGARTLLSHYLHGWRNTGMGAAAASPPAFAFLGVGGIVLLGKVALLQKLLVIAAWPVAAVGAWRLGRPLQSGLGRLVLVVTYLAVPLSYNSLARGRWDGLLVYAAAPWLFLRVARLCGLHPYQLHDDDLVADADGAGAEGTGGRPVEWRLAVVGLAVGLALVGALAPAVVVAVLLMAGGLVVGSVVTGTVRPAVRGLAATAAAVGGAALLLAPWSLEVVLGGGFETLTGVPPPPADAPGLGALLRFQVGPLGAAPVGWAFLVAALLPLVLGQRWRLDWAVRCWAMVLLSVGVAWAGGRNWFPVRVQAADVLLAPAAVGLALAAALGAAVFEADLSRYRFGWRQAASVVAAAAVTVATVPVIVGAADGRWRLPSTELARSLAWMAPTRSEGSFRVLWLGDPEVLPLGAWNLGDGAAYATSRDGMPVATDLLPGAPSAATRRIVAALGEAQRGDTARLGRLLAPLAVRYLVLPRQLSGGDRRGTQRPPPPSLTGALQSQLDLRLLPSDPAAVVYENTAWGPARALRPIDDPTLAAGTRDGIGTEGADGADLRGGRPVLEGVGPVQFAGEVPSAGRVFVSEAPSSRWELTVGGQQAARETAYGVANAYTATETGNGVLRYRTPLWRYAALLGQVLLWVGAVRAIRGLRRRAGRAGRSQ